MVKYEKTKSGYCYEIKNGKKKRISLEDYKKKSKSNKGSRSKKGGINENDILGNRVYTKLRRGDNTPFPPYNPYTQSQHFRRSSSLRRNSSYKNEVDEPLPAPTYNFKNQYIQ